MHRRSIIIDKSQLHIYKYLPFYESLSYITNTELCSERVFNKPIYNTVNPNIHIVFCHDDLFRDFNELHLNINMMNGLRQRINLTYDI